MPKKGECKLTPEQRVYVVESWRSGKKTQRELGDELGVSSANIHGICKSAGITNGLPYTFATEISKARWAELYWEREKPSVCALARTLGISHQTVRRHLRKHGIQMRTKAEQQSIDIKLGRRPNTGGWKGRGGNEPGVQPEWLKLSPAKSKQRSAKSAVARRASVSIPCGWCGINVERWPSRLERYKYICCNASHRSKLVCLRTHHGPDAPRPLIVEKLKALAEERYARVNVSVDPRTSRTTRLAPTPEQLAKVAPEIGARQPEIDAVLDLCFEEYAVAEQPRG